VRRRDGRLSWADRGLTHSRGWSEGPVRGATPLNRHWGPLRHRPLRSSGWPRYRARPTRRNASGASGASAANRRHSGRSAVPTSNAARTKRTGSARWLLAAAVPPSAAEGTAPRARATTPVAGTSPVSSVSAARNHGHACVDVRHRSGEGAFNSLPFSFHSSLQRSVPGALVGRVGPLRRVSDSRSRIRPLPR
jgi:hypothetical protein